MKKIGVFLLILTLALVETSVPKVSVVLADAASVSNVVFYTRQSDNHTILNITVLHFNYYPGHYVNSVQIDVNGTIYTTVPSSTQPLNQPFLVQYDMGVVIGTLIVSARAICIIHGSAGSSSPVVVPEFSTATLLIALLALTGVSLKTRRR